MYQAVSIELFKAMSAIFHAHWHTVHGLAVTNTNFTYTPNKTKKIVLLLMHMCFVLPLQFAYKRNGGTDDTVLTMMNYTKFNAYARILFLDFNQRFNTTRVDVLLERYIYGCQRVSGTVD